MPAIETAVHVRWMIRRDFAELLAIEAGSWDRPWSEEDFLVRLRARNCIGMVAELPAGASGLVAGLMVCELHRDYVELLNFAVHPEYRHESIGSQLMRKMRSKLSSHRRYKVCLAVREFHEGTLDFLWNNGFVITTPVVGWSADVLAGLPNGVAQDYLLDHGVDDLRMEYTLPPRSDHNG